MLLIFSRIEHSGFGASHHQVHLRVLARSLAGVQHVFAIDVNEFLKNYSEIHLFLDNDKAGENCKTSILKSFPEAKNHSEIYALHKDLNEYFVFRNNTKIEKQQQVELNPKQEQEESEIYQTYKRKR